MMQEFIFLLFGEGATLVRVLADLIMYMVGSAVVILIDISRRNVQSERTPEKFELKFFFKDNATRIMLNLAIGFLLLIVRTDIQSVGADLLGFSYKGIDRILPLIAGLSSDMIALYIKNKFQKEND